MEILISENPNFLLKYLSKNLNNLIFSYIDLWEYISEFVLLDENDIIKYEKYINWKSYSKGINKITNNIVKNFCNKIDWDILFKKWKNKYEIIQYDHICFMSIGFESYNWKYINENKEWFYSISFIDCFNKVINWEYTLINLQLPIYIIDRYYEIIKKIHFTNLLYKHQNLINANFIEKRKNELNWDSISLYQKINENQMILYKHLLKWSILFNRFTMSIDTLKIIENYSFIFNYNLNIIIITQPITEDILIKYIHMINPREILKNNKIDINIKNNIYKNNLNQYIYLLKNRKFIKFTYFNTHY